jgi:hypothetical protein
VGGKKRRIKQERGKDKGRPVERGQDEDEKR